jgi:hypothetical protein
VVSGVSILGDAAVPGPAPLTVGKRGAAIEVATYVSQDPAKVTIDPATGVIDGADLALVSHVDLDGNANHVVAEVLADRQRPAAHQTVVEIHARLLEVSVAARRSSVAKAADRGAP